MRLAHDILPLLEKASKQGGGQYAEHYAAIQEDTKYIVDICLRYRNEVAGVDEDPKAFTEGYNKIFREVLPNKVSALKESLSGNRREQIRAEAKLRTVYHIIGEGLGAITGIWGMNAAMRELQTPSSSQSQGIELPGLMKLVADMTIIERRHIAFGLNELGRLSQEAYFPTVLSVLKEFKTDKPILEQMRNETFNRWGVEFPFAIDREQLAGLGKQRVLGWIGKHILTRPGVVPRKRLSSLEDIV
jgi:hypothetical protein